MKIFVSYSSKTKSIVSELADDLIASGYTVWFDRELTGGRQWWADILQQIRDCELFLFVLTQQSLDSLPCQSEYSYADALGKRILPVQMDDINVAILPKPLQKIHFVDYRLRDKKQLAALNKALNSLPPQSPPPSWTVTEPPAPLSPLAELRERIDNPNLSLDVQKGLVYDLTAAYHDPTMRTNVRMLIELLLRRETEININIYQELKSILLKMTDWRQLTFQHGSDIRSVAFSPSGDAIITGGDAKSLKLWHVNDGREINEFSGHNDTVYGIAFSPDGRFVVSAGGDTIIRLWDGTSGHEIYQVVGHAVAVSSLAFSPDGEFFVSSGWDSTIRLWDTKSGHTIRKFKVQKNVVLSVNFSPNSQFIVSGGGDCTIRIWDVKSGLQIREFIGHDLMVYSVAFSPDGRFIVSGGGDTPIRLWDVESGFEIRKFLGHKNAVPSVAFSPNGSFLVSGSGDSTVRLWDINTGLEIQQFNGHTGGIFSVAFSPDGRAILSGSRDGTARIWPLDGII